MSLQYFWRGLYLHVDHDSITVLKPVLLQQGNEMRFQPFTVSAHYKYATLCPDVFTHEWNNLQEHCEIYLLIVMKSVYLKITFINQTHLSLAKIDLLFTTNNFKMTVDLHNKS